MIIFGCERGAPGSRDNRQALRLRGVRVRVSCNARPTMPRLDRQRRRHDRAMSQELSWRIAIGASNQIDYHYFNHCGA